MITINPLLSHSAGDDIQKILKEIKLSLDEDLVVRLEDYLTHDDPCTRWDTPEDGEDYFQMFLRIKFAATDQGFWTNYEDLHKLFKVK